MEKRQPSAVRIINNPSTETAYELYGNIFGFITKRDYLSCNLKSTSMDNEELVVIREYDSITRAEMAKSLLESEGIFATIRSEYMSAIYPIGTMPAEIVVREEDAEWASALLRSMDGEDAAK